MAPAAFNNLESPLSMVEKTSKWILPVISALQKCLIKENHKLNKEGSGMADIEEHEEEEI